MTSGSIWTTNQLIGSRAQRNQLQAPWEGTHSGSRRRHRTGAVADINLFSLNKFASQKSLRYALDQLKAGGGHAAGVDGITFSDFSPTEWCTVRRMVCKALMNKTYKPHPTKLVRIPKGDDRYRELSLQTVMDRTVAKNLQLRTSPYWRSQLPNIGCGVLDVYAAIAHDIRTEGKYILAVDDIRDCYPSAPIEPILALHRQHINQPDLLWLVEQVILGHEGPERTIGLDQGSPYSPVAMELLLHTHLDAQFGTGRQGHPSLYRYADNLTFLCSDVREGRQTLEEAGEILNQQGFTLKGQDGEPRDIRNPDYDLTILGYIPRWLNGGLVLDLPEIAFQNLQESFEKAKETPNPEATAQAIAEGWMNHAGPTLSNSMREETVDIVKAYNREAGFYNLNRRTLLEAGKRARKAWLERLNQRTTAIREGTGRVTTTRLSNTAPSPTPSSSITSTTFSSSINATRYRACTEPPATRQGSGESAPSN